MTSVLLSIEHGRLQLNRHLIFEDLNFELQRGQHWAFRGPSGSGKSAFLQLLAGKHQLSGGRIHYWFHENYLAENTASDGQLSFSKLVAMVESRHHFRTLSGTSDFYYQQRYNSTDSDNSLTVTEYLRSIPHPDGRHFWTREKLIALLQLEFLASEQLIKLSNGETKRLLIAAALLKNPMVLLLDNPLAGLDAGMRQQFGSILNAIAASGISVLMSTSTGELPEIISHVGLFGQGGTLRQMPRADFNDGTCAEGREDCPEPGELSALLNARQKNVTYERIVVMNRVSIRYGDKQVLKDIDWEIAPGERWALFGANGAGKSTLLSLISGDNPQAYANDIWLFDRRRGSGESIWDIKKKTGFISPELFQYFPTDTSCLNAVESGFFDTMGLFRPHDRERNSLALRWMRALEIDRYERQLLKNVPAGVQRLCLLARALIKNPDLLILDEPAQGLDAHQIRHLRSLIDSICALTNLTLIYVTHYEEELPACVTRVLKLDQGMVVGKTQP